jgi:putative SOS response-associated peptidase YedK
MRLKVIPCVNSDQSKKTSAQYEWIFISQWQSALIQLSQSPMLLCKITCRNAALAEPRQWAKTIEKRRSVSPGPRFAA